MNKDERTLNLVLEASNEVCIRAVVIFAEGMFEGESHIWFEKAKSEGEYIDFAGSQQKSRATAIK